MYFETATVVVKNQKDVVVGSEDFQRPVFTGPEGTAPDQLLADTLGYYQTEFPGDNSILRLLKDAQANRDIALRTPIRKKITDRLAGPEKSIEKAAKLIMAARIAKGKPITMEQARAKALASMED